MASLLGKQDHAEMERLKITQADRLRFARMLKPCLKDCPTCHGSCLLFTGYKQRGVQRGYGSFKFRRGRTVTAHRFAYFAEHSLWLLPGGDVCHVECRHRACCDPRHLYLDTHKANQYAVTKIKTRTFPAMPVPGPLPVLAPREAREQVPGEIIV
ncbi:MAG TPA: hypothetical protein VE957_18470 [Terriglobales bacterium]|nr:hypothetical protein [Terriglobales bacterium]